MRRVLHLLLTLSVLWCGLHLSEAVAAGDVLGSDRCSAAQAEAKDCEPGNKPSGAADACHHHCPVAPELRVAAIGDVIAPLAAPPHRRLFAPLTSRSQSPPLEPPTA